MGKAIFHTPLGWAGVALSEKGIAMVALPRQGKNDVKKVLYGAASPFTPARSRGGRGSAKMLEKAVRLLRRYFDGESVSFDLPFDLRYYTPFQQAVWRAAAEIPYGETRSYAGVAKRIGNPRAARAVGQALGANPIPVLVP